MIKLHHAANQDPDLDAANQDPDLDAANQDQDLDENIDQDTPEERDVLVVVLLLGNNYNN